MKYHIYDKIIKVNIIIMIFLFLAGCTHQLIVVSKCKAIEELTEMENLWVCER